MIIKNPVFAEAIASINTRAVDLFKVKENP